MIEAILTIMAFFVFAYFVIEHDIAEHKKMFKNFKNKPKF